MPDAFPALRRDARDHEVGLTDVAEQGVRLLEHARQRSAPTSAPTT